MTKQLFKEENYFNAEIITILYGALSHPVRLKALIIWVPQDMRMHSHRGQLQQVSWDVNKTKTAL